MGRKIALTAVCAIALTACATIPAGDAPIRTDDIPPDYATAPLDLSTPTATAYSMMIGMYRGDVAMIDQVFAPNATLNRLRADGEVRMNGLTPWRDWVSTLEIGQADEQLFDIEVKQFDRLATVWTPFIIRIDGELRGCGVNHFTMVDLAEDGAPSEWRILSGIDEQAPVETCDTFRDTAP